MIATGSLAQAPTPRPLAELTEDGELRVHFHRGQAQAYRSERRFVFIISGTQAGKTSFGPHWLRREIERCGPGDYLGVTSTFPLLKLKMLPEFLRLFRDALRLGEWHASDRVFQFAHEPIRVIFGSATNPDSLESATAKAAWLDECGQDEFRQDSWEAVQRRLAIHQGRVLGTTTPYNLGWLKQQVFERWRAGDTDYDVIQFPSTTNPAFPQAEYERAARTLAAWKFRMFYGGQFERPAGLIYSDYHDVYREEDGHLVRPFPIPPAWPSSGGLDFGGVHTARLIVREDPASHVYYVTGESLEGGKTTAEHAAAARAAVEGTNHRTWRGGSKSEDQQRLDWQAAGVWVLGPDVVDVEAGIDRVIALFKAYRLYVFDSCRGLRDELGTYSRVIGAQGEPTEKIKDKETFHRLDALRYLVQSLGGSGVGVEWI